jgi:hypothetical protein
MEEIDSMNERRQGNKQKEEKQLGFITSGADSDEDE